MHFNVFDSMSAVMCTSLIIQHDYNESSCTHSESLNDRWL